MIEDSTSEQPAPVHVALSRVMADVQAVSKDSRNTSQNFNFRGIDAVMNAAGPAFRKHGVLALPKVLSKEQWTDTTKSGGQQLHVLLNVRYTFVGPAGDILETEVYGEAADSGDKAFSKATSVAFRTCLLQALCIPTDEPDPDLNTYQAVNGEMVKLLEAVDGAATPAALLDALKAASARGRRALDQALPYAAEGGEATIREVANEKAALMVDLTEDVDSLRTLHTVAKGLGRDDLMKAITVKAGAAEKSAEQQARDAADRNGVGEEEPPDAPAGVGVAPDAPIYGDEVARAEDAYEAAANAGADWPEPAKVAKLRDSGEPDSVSDHGNPVRKAAIQALTVQAGGADAMDEMIAQEFGRHINDVATAKLQTLVGFLGGKP